MRIFAQLGILDKVVAVSDPLGDIGWGDHSGNKVDTLKWFVYDKSK